MMPTLFTYCIPFDDGAAPNPYWDVCTLVICKPNIRLAAEIGDWVVGTGSANSPIGDISGQVVYAMKITRKLSMREYYDVTKREIRDKIPDWNNRDVRRRLGDSIYDFSFDPPRVRKSVHTEANRAKDLSGGYALLSDHFFYFGDKPVQLPPDLVSVVRQGQGHRSKSNNAYFKRFVEWIRYLRLEPNTLVGKPQIDLFADEARLAECARGRLEEDEGEYECV